MKFVDLFAGLGGFHTALTSLGHECVFASELDSELRDVYGKNFSLVSKRIVGDIRAYRDKVPKHQILCAGFPCQPFSKSGFQEGLLDKTRGTLFHEVLEVLTKWMPPFVILENVGNFERHDQGRTWKIVRESLEALGYHVKGTEHVATGGHGLISPHHLGYPHNRERFFMVATLDPLEIDPFPPRISTSKTSLKDIEQTKSELTKIDLSETRLLEHYVRCINHWNRLLKSIPDEVNLPSFPIWGDELNATYPYKDKTPSACTASELKSFLGPQDLKGLTLAELLSLLPSYARRPGSSFPSWKVAFIEKNRNWFENILPYVTTDWVTELKEFPPSLRKLEWNCQGEERDLWQHVLQFRPSGLRVKRYSSSPALVAMTTTQIPILGPKRRMISRVEGLRLQGFPDNQILPESHERAFRALGNAVHVGVVKAIAGRVFQNN